MPSVLCPLTGLLCSPPLPGIAAALGQRGGRRECLLVFQLSEAGDLFYQPLLHQAAGEGAGRGWPLGPLPEEGPCPDPPTPTTPTLSAAAAASCHTWLKAFEGSCQGAPAAPRHPRAIRKSRLFRKQDLQQQPGAVATLQGARQHLRQAMRGHRLLCPWEPGPTPPVAVPPVPELAARQSHLHERLLASWTGGWGRWWQDRLGRTKAQKRQALREQQRRRKRARGTPSLSLSFTSSPGSPPVLSDLSQGSTAGPRVSCAPQEDCPLPASQDSVESLLSSQTLSKRGIPRERRRTLRDFLAVLERPTAEPPEEEEEDQTVAQLASQRSRPPLPSSQASSATPRKRTLMGF